jgi:predicted GIY-YIG superfamily endonuclease
MHYTYLLLSEAGGQFYAGTTRDLRNRVQSTTDRRPLSLVYYKRA